MSPPIGGSDLREAVTPSEANDQRDAVVRAALAVMMRRGIGATTVQDVASEAGISTGMFHYLVQSMDVVRAEAFRRVARADLEATRTEISPCSVPIDRMRVLLKAYSAGEDIGASQLWVDTLAEAGCRPALRLATREYSLEWQRLLVA